MKIPHKAMTAILATTGLIAFSSLAAAQDIKLPRRTPELRRLEITNTVTKNSPAIDVRLPSRSALSSPTPALGTMASQVTSDLGSTVDSLLQQVPTSGSASMAQTLSSALSSALPRQGSVQITIPSELLSSLPVGLPNVSDMPSVPAQ